MFKNLTGFPAANGSLWGDPMNNALGALSSHMGLNVISEVFPFDFDGGYGVDGDAQLSLLTGVYACKNNGVWVLYSARAGVIAYRVSPAKLYANTGSAWVDASSGGGGGGDAPTRSYGYEVSLGNVAGVSEVSFFGANAAVPAVVNGEPIWSPSLLTYPFPTAAKTLTISSNNADDTAAGTGMQSATVKWIDFTTGAESTLVIALNGQTPVTITTNGYLPNFSEGASYGANGTNLGTINIGYGQVTAGVPANILSQIPQAGNIAPQAIYTVPAGKTFDISQAIYATSGACTFQIREYLFGAATAQYRLRNQTMVVEAFDAMGRDGIISIAARNTVVIQAASVFGTTSVTASIKGFLR